MYYENGNEIDDGMIEWTVNLEHEEYLLLPAFSKSEIEHSKRRSPLEYL